MRLDDNIQQQLEKTFLSESDDIILAMENDLLDLEESSDDDELVKDLLRNAHTLKGSSGMIGPDILPQFIHEYETVLKTVLNSPSEYKDVFSFLLGKLDFIKELVNVLVRKKEELDEQKFKNQLGELENFEQRNKPAEQQQEDNAAFGFFDYTEETVINEAYGFFEFDDEKKGKKRKFHADKNYYRIYFKLHEKRMENTWRPEDLLEDLSKIGTIIHVTSRPFEMVNWQKADFSQCFFEWRLILESDETLDHIEDVFLFFKKNNDIEIESVDKEDLTKIGEILVTEGAISEEELTSTLESRKKIGEILEDENKIQKEDLSRALKLQDKFKKSLHIDDEIKISTKKVDSLIDLVGELVIANSNLNNIQQEGGNVELDLDQIQYNINKISRHMRDVILSLKMVPIGQLLTKYFRMVRDLSREFGKKISLELEGEGTELDKTMFDTLQEPLLHLLRNSIDHGIETPEDRVKHDKPEEGVIIISASHENGQVLIEIRDDGRGLDKNKIQQKGVEKGLLQKDKHYSDEEIFSVIFEAGFSTKDKTSIVSGRGVGMDAVQNGVRKLNGSIKTKSEPGKGTSFTISLPLTLAIIEGFLVRVGSNYFVIPLAFIAECFEERLDFLVEKGMSYNLRNEYLSVVKLDDFFSNVSYDKNDKSTRQIVVLHLADGNKLGMMIDEIIGEIQAVIKPLASVINKSRIITGSTLLGSGEVALILDITNLFDKFNTMNESMKSKLLTAGKKLEK